MGRGCTRASQAPTACGVQAAAGTWQGAAPRGFLKPEQQGGRVEPQRAALQRPAARDVRVGRARMPLLGYGTCEVDQTAIEAALAAGYTHLDCASFYGNEDAVGRAMAPMIAAGKRSDLYITSKVWNDAHRADALRVSCEKSIKDLGCSYLDLYLVHWPVAWKAGTKEVDTEATMEETWAAMEKLVDDGLVKEIGVANFGVKQVEDLLKACRIKPVVNQVELHPLLAQRKLVGVCMRLGVQCVAYSALGSTGSGSAVRDIAAVATLAEKKGKTPAQMLLKWGVQRGTPVLVRSRTPAHIESNMDVFDWKLDEFEKVKIDALNEDKRMVDPEWHTFPDPEEGGLTKPSHAFGDGQRYN